MLDLDARVHLHEIETIVFVEQKLKSARARIADALARGDRRFAHLFAQLRGHHGRRRFFQKFLMTALNRAFALAEMNTVAVFVGQHLNLDVARALDVTLDVNIAVLEGRRRFGRRRLERWPKLVFRAHDAHAAPAAAGRRFDDHRKAYFAREFDRFFLGFKRLGAAGQDRHAGLLHRAARFDLFAHHLNDVGRGPINLILQASQISAK